METQRLARGGSVACTIFFIFTPSLLLAGHSPKRFRTFSYVSAPMAQCPNAGVPPVNIAYTIRVMIPPNFSNALVFPPPAAVPVRDVYYEKGATGTANDKDKIGTPLPGPAGKGDKSLFDMDLTQLPNGSIHGPQQAYARIRLLIEDTSEYSFYKETLASGAVVNGVADGGLLVGKVPSTSPTLCVADPGKDTDTAKPPMPLVQFYVPIYAAPVQPKAVVRAFNIGLLPTMMLDTPILIDPKMMNNG